MIAIVDYGVGNLRSVQKAFESLGCTAEITGDRQRIAAADRIVLPGVGAFASGMEGLRRAGLIDTVKQEAQSGKPFLGICLGMQMLLTESDEGGRHAGLDLIPGRVQKFEVSLKIPHMGWNGIAFCEDPVLCGLKRGESVYFVHSHYCATEKRYSLATTEYGVTFVSAVKRGNLYGFQFHPEKSGSVGLKLLENFVKLESKGQ